MASEMPGTTVETMNDILISPYAAWRRQNATHHYVGSVWGSPDGLRLAGREPSTGIHVTLAVPAEEIEGIRLSSDSDERLAGERCVILELVDTIPILVREIGVGPLEPDELAACITEVVKAPAPL